jgi:biotin operon repressor
LADDLKNARTAIERQIAELEGQVERLRGALAYLDEVDAAGVPKTTAPARATRRGKKSSASSRRKSRAKSSGSRAPRGERQKQFLAVVKKQPGAKAVDIAKEMGITPNQVHGLAHRLSQAGQIRKQRRGGYALAS